MYHSLTGPTRCSCSCEASAASRTRTGTDAPSFYLLKHKDGVNISPGESIQFRIGLFWFFRKKSRTFLHVIIYVYLSEESQQHDSHVNCAHGFFFLSFYFFHDSFIFNAFFTRFIWFILFSPGTCFHTSDFFPPNDSLLRICFSTWLFPHVDHFFFILKFQKRFVSHDSFISRCNFSPVPFFHVKIIKHFCYFHDSPFDFFFFKHDSFVCTCDFSIWFVFATYGFPQAVFKNDSFHDSFTFGCNFSTIPFFHVIFSPQTVLVFSWSISCCIINLIPHVIFHTIQIFPHGIFHDSFPFCLTLFQMIHLIYRIARARFFFFLNSFISKLLIHFLTWLSTVHLFTHMIFIFFHLCFHVSFFQTISTFSTDFFSHDLFYLQL